MYRKMSVSDAFQLNESEMFSEIREGLLLGQEHTQNLLDCKDDLLFAWNPTKACILVTNWRLAQSKPNTNVMYQTLIPSTPPIFEIDRLIVSNEGSLVALVGPRGVAIQELPRRWGKSGQFMEGKKQITCRTHCVDALFFNNNPHMEVRQTRWHPGSTTDSHILVLISNNTIRVYNSANLRYIWQVGPLQVGKNPNTSLGPIGESIVDFDFAPAVKLPSNSNSTYLNNGTFNQSLNSTSDKTTKCNKFSWPLVVLRENGNIYVLMNSLDGDKARLQGPITIAPQIQDNYGADSCAILVVPSTPPTLVIAESNGKMHHALFLEAEAPINSSIEVDENLDIEPSNFTAHVLETVELELGLPETENRQNNSSYNCPIHLMRDSINELRYFVYHETGLHVVCINFIAEIQRYLESKCDNDIELFSTPSNAEYLVCTRVDRNDRVNAVIGFVLLQMPAGLVLLLSSGQVVSLKLVVDVKLLDTSRQSKWSVEAREQLGQLVDAPTFVEHIKSILQRNVTQPILSVDKSSNHSLHECYELLNQTMEVLRQNYLKRHELVKAEFSKRINLIRLQKEQQLQEIDNLERYREIISARAHKLAERFEEVSDTHENLLKQCHNLMRKANVSLPSNVAAEREFTQAVSQINKATKNMAMSLDRVKKSINKQSYHINKGNELASPNSFELPEKQQQIITEILTEIASEIDRQIKDITRVKKLVGV